MTVLSHSQSIFSSINIKYDVPTGCSAKRQMATYFLSWVGKFNFMFKEIWENTLIWNPPRLNLQNRDSLDLKTVFSKHAWCRLILMSKSMGFWKNDFFITAPLTISLFSFMKKCSENPRRTSKRCVGHDLTGRSFASFLEKLAWCPRPLLKEVPNFQRTE